MALKPGDQLGRFQLKHVLGTGGFATVFAAHDEALDSAVAIKVLADNHSQDAELRERFLAEGRLLRKTVNPNLIQVFDVGETDDGQPYLVLQIAEGGTIADRLRDGRRASESDIHHLVEVLTEGVSALHKMSIVHRDLSPANMFITNSGTGVDASGEGGLLDLGERLLIGDLGLAKDLSDSSGLTAGAGSLRYASPEQQSLVGTVTPASDVYSASALVASLVDDTSLSEPMRAGLGQGMRAVPEERPQSMHAWRQTLFDQATPKSEPKSVRVLAPLVLLALGMIAAAGVVLVMSRTSNSPETTTVMTIYQSEAAPGWTDMSWGNPDTLGADGDVMLSPFGAVSLSTGRPVSVEATWLATFMFSAELLPDLAIILNDETGQPGEAFNVDAAKHISTKDGVHTLAVPISLLDLDSLKLTRISLTERRGESAQLALLSITLEAAS